MAIAQRQLDTYLRVGVKAAQPSSCTSSSSSSEAYSKWRYINWSKIIIFFLFFFWPTSTKPVGTKKLSLFGMAPQKLSAGNVLLNAIALPLWTTIDKRWNRYCVSSGSLVTSEIRFVFLDLERIPQLVRSRIFQFPLIWEQTCEWSPGVHFCHLVACRCIRCSTCLDAVYYCAGVTSRSIRNSNKSSQANGLPRDQGIRVAPSGLFPSTDKPTGSFTTGI